jgi:hypothetical protein
MDAKQRVINVWVVVIKKKVVVRLRNAKQYLGFL